MFVSTLPSVCRKSPSLIYVICVCLRIRVSNTYCVVFLFCLYCILVSYVASFSLLSICDSTFGALKRLFKTVEGCADFIDEIHQCFVPISIDQCADVYVSKVVMHWCKIHIISMINEYYKRRVHPWLNFVECGLIF